ncbi:MAG: hypothetical protein MUE44_05135 [Oscillatoriaceae cyanobacterium Prado104]|jgi:hypothetical protein|nr:hypothetical protein [Oscillatoriaceae cyanobacterium Prado104]
MPEADLRANQHQPQPDARSDTEPFQRAAGGFEALAPHPIDPSTVLQQPEEDWQTVNFPNAMSVDAIPTKLEAGNSQSVPTTPVSTSPPISDNLKNLMLSAEQAKGKGGTPVTLMQALHECNRDLLQRIAQLEKALEESHNSLQAREALLQQRDAELQETQEQLIGLFGKLEISNQTLQNQEILVESLTKQSATSQTRLAELERECALTQQRYNEQQQQLVAAENVCRELRSRLHRQQRHTLQFKAALERSLEMPHQKLPVNIESCENADDVASAHLESLLAAVNDRIVPVPATLNPSPVKTWSDRTQQHSDSADAATQAESELDASQELNILASASETALPEVQAYWHLAPTARKAGEPQLPLAEPEPEIAAKLNSPNLMQTGQILSSGAISGMPEAPESKVKSRSNQQPEWLTSIANFGVTVKKRRSLAEIELPSFR